jgi:hypothetical protein
MCNQSLQFTANQSPDAQLFVAYQKGMCNDWLHIEEGGRHAQGNDCTQRPDDELYHTTYIHATTERVWRGLTDPTVTKRYWRHHSAGAKTFRSDWKIGSTYDLAHEEVGLVVSDPGQVILESDRVPGRLRTGA